MDVSPPSGGFLLSPPASSTISSISASSTRTTLPRPRASPLRAGGSKESAFIRFADQQLLHIQRRFAKRTTPSSAQLSDVDRDRADPWGDVKGYASMKEACRDLEELVGVVWVSGTPSLQVSYLIAMGSLLGNMVLGMPPSPKSLFRLLAKFDYAFASLLQARDVETGERLPGFDGGRGVSGTEKVRIRSLIERTRRSVLETFKRGEFDGDEDDDDDDDEDDRKNADRMDTEEDNEGLLILEDENQGMREEEDESFDMQIARVYDRTMVELGDSLTDPDIGIITEARG